MKISTKITLGFAALIGLNACIGAWLYHGVTQTDHLVHERMQESHEENQASEHVLLADSHLAELVIHWNNVLLHKDDPKAVERHLADFKSESAVMEGLMEKAAVEAAQVDVALGRQVEDLKREHDRLIEALLKAADELRSGDNTVVNRTTGLHRKLAADLESLAERMMERAGKAEAALIAAEEQGTANTKSLTLALIIGGLVAGIVATAVSVVSINRSLRLVIDDLAQFASQTASASSQLATASQSLADGTSETAAALEETSASIEEISGQVRQATVNSESTTQVATQARETGERGAQAIAELAKAIGAIKENADRTAKIVKTIDEIAFQTNLLALNAAVEAARAGDAGKGFAVVAEEVRNLAQRAGDAARNTTDLIEQSVSSAEAGVSLSQNVIRVVNEMTSASRKVNDLVAEITGTSREINIGVGQISKAVRQMDQTTQSNAANSEENSALGEELARQAESLLDVVMSLEAMIRTVDRDRRDGGMHDLSQRKTTGKRAPAKPAPTSHAHSAGVNANGNGSHGSRNGKLPERSHEDDHALVASSARAKEAIPLPEDEKDRQTLSRF